MLKKIFTVIGFLAVISVIGSATATAASATANTVATSTQIVAASKFQGLTSRQANAVRKAKSYLSFTAFSRSGLIHQLKFDGSSTKNSTFAVDYTTVSWRYQAYRKAKSYLRFTGFSLSGLIG